MLVSTFVRKFVFVVGFAIFSFFPIGKALAVNCQIFPTPDDFPKSTVFASPFDPNNFRSLLMTAKCNISGVTLGAGSGEVTDFIYKTGYILKNGRWQQLTYFGNLQTNDWIIGSATAFLPSSLVTPGTNTYFLGFACVFSDGGWKCGCRDNTCNNSFWSIQGFRSNEAVSPPPAEDKLTGIELPAGFHIHYFAKNVNKARSLALGDNDTVFVGNKDGGTVYALVDENGDMVADMKYVIASGLTEPNGVAFANGSLYVAERSRILRYQNIETALDDPPEPTVIFNKLPNDPSHGWKYLAFGPDDGYLYFGIGAPCNACKRDDIRYATISRIKPDGSGFEVFASGIRNSVGFDWNPDTKELWFTDNGRDYLGDDSPADELNRAQKSGMNFGFPSCHAGDIPDPILGSKTSCNDFIPPALKLGPHVAALGMKFYEGTMFPERYHGDIFIAEHGSWNRTTKLGYRITHVHVNSDKAESYEPFAEGWLQGQNVWGRPVDVLNLPDGSLLISDDFNNAVYRIYYTRDS